jgi:hypothetical protein
MTRIDCVGGMGGIGGMGGTSRPLLVQRAVEFLMSPSANSDSSVYERINFLEKGKGLTSAEIAEALQRAKPLAPETNIVAQAAARGESAAAALQSIPVIRATLLLSSLHKLYNLLLMCPCDVIGDAGTTNESHIKSSGNLDSNNSSTPTNSNFGNNFWCTCLSGPTYCCL